MAKTFNDLYESIYDFENLFNAYLKARKNKRYSGEVLHFTANLEENLITLQNELIHRTYRSGRYREFYIYEPKERLIMALPFRDRVVHHALINVIEDIFEKRFIYDTYACRVGKGTHKGADRVTQFLRETQRKWGKTYCLKADVSKYFPSINHRILKDILFRRITCKGTRWLIEEIIDSSAEPGELNPRGIPIGNLTSQLFANVYLGELDYFVKFTLGEKYYVRYMDDFVILHNDKRHLRYLRGEIEDFLKARLDLSLNHKTGIFPVSQGVDFLGYRIWSTHRLLRKNSVKRIKRALKKLQRDYSEGKASVDKVRSVVSSWVGHASHANTYRLRTKVLQGFTLTRPSEDQ